MRLRNEKGELLLLDQAGHNDVAEVGEERYWSWLKAALRTADKSAVESESTSAVRRVPRVRSLLYRLPADVPDHDRSDIDRLQCWFNALPVTHDHYRQRAGIDVLLGNARYIRPR